MSSEEISKLENEFINGYVRTQTYFNTLWINDPQREYIIEVDLLYDSILHDRDDDFPMAPENTYICLSMLSLKQHQLQMKYYGATSSTKHKLIFYVVKILH